MALRTWQELIRADYPELDTGQDFLESRKRGLDRFDRLEAQRLEESYHPISHNLKRTRRLAHWAYLTYELAKYLLN